MDRPQTAKTGANGTDSEPLLGIYRRLLSTAEAGGGSEDFLRRVPEAFAEFPWPAALRRLSVFLVDPVSGALRLVAVPGAPVDAVPPCRAADSEACLCQRALGRGNLLVIDGASLPQGPPCDPSRGGTHLVLPLSSHGQDFGLLHALLDPDGHLPPVEESFLSRAMALIGAELRRRHRDEEHDRLEMQFFQAQKMEAVGRLAGGVSHDFNNILTAITSYSELGLFKLGPQDPIRRYFEEILAATDRAALLTQQLLAFSRRQILSPRILDLNAVIPEMGKMLRRLLGEDIELIIKTDPGLPQVSADPAQIEQMIINLAVNSRDALPRGGKIVIETDDSRLDETFVEHHPEVSPGRYACIAFSDTGTGMTEEVRRRIFEPFYTTKEQHTGSGLGLAAVYGIIRQSGGHVSVHSEPGVGTTFRIYFPAVEDGAAPPAQIPNLTALPRGTETVLLAEDDDSVRSITVEILRDLGYRLLEAREGNEALAVVAAHDGPLDLLVTDVVMPHMSGKELYHQLAATRPGLRVLFVSGCTDEAIIHHGIIGSGAELLQKPFSPWALSNRVRQILDAPSTPPRE